MTYAQTTPLHLRAPEEEEEEAAAAAAAAAAEPEPAAAAAAAQVEDCQHMLQHRLQIRRRYQVSESFAKQIS